MGTPLICCSCHHIFNGWSIKGNLPSTAQRWFFLQPQNHISSPRYKVWNDYIELSFSYISWKAYGISWFLSGKATLFLFTQEIIYANVDDVLGFLSQPILRSLLTLRYNIRYSYLTVDSRTRLLGRLYIQFLRWYWENWVSILDSWKYCVCPDSPTESLYHRHLPYWEFEWHQISRIVWWWSWSHILEVCNGEKIEWHFVFGSACVWKCIGHNMVLVGLTTCTLWVMNLYLVIRWVYFHKSAYSYSPTYDLYVLSKRREVGLGSVVVGVGWGGGLSFLKLWCLQPGFT